jgi:hypothetical protein
MKTASSSRQFAMALPTAALRKGHRPVLGYLAQGTLEGSAEFVPALFAMPGRIR